MRNKRIKRAHIINNDIKSNEIRVITDNGSEIMSKNDALRMAREGEMDLILISPKANPPVCKIQEYGKFLYDIKKREKELKSNQKKTDLKEIKYTPNTDEHDYNFKLENAKKFLTKGHKLKATVFFKGREITFTEQGKILLLRLAQDLSDYGKLEKMPELQGKRMSVMINPKYDKSE